MQTKGETRGFICPETEEPCTNTACAEGRVCAESDRLALARAREVADKQGRQYSARFWEIVGHILPRK
jgi:hypothetical protein